MKRKIVNETDLDGDVGLVDVDELVVPHEDGGVVAVQANLRVHHTMQPTQTQDQLIRQKNQQVRVRKNEDDNFFGLTFKIPKTS